MVFQSISGIQSIHSGEVLGAATDMRFQGGALDKCLQLVFQIISATQSMHSGMLFVQLPRRGCKGCCGGQVLTHCVAGHFIYSKQTFWGGCWCSRREDVSDGCIGQVVTDHI